MIPVLDLAFDYLRVCHNWLSSWQVTDTRTASACIIAQEMTEIPLTFVQASRDYGQNSVLQQLRKLTPAAADIIQHMLVMDVRARMTSAQAVQHEFCVAQYSIASTASTVPVSCVT